MISPRSPQSYIPGMPFVASLCVTCGRTIEVSYRPPCSGENRGRIILPRGGCAVFARYAVRVNGQEVRLRVRVPVREKNTATAVYRYQYGVTVYIVP